jgi:uncharacterized protein (TIGR03000 family)
MFRHAFSLAALAAGLLAANVRAEGLDGEPYYARPAAVIPYHSASSYYPYSGWGAFDYRVYPTYMTSINYPLIYGAYDTLPYSPAPYTFGAMRSQYSSKPAGYSLLYLPPAAGLDYRPMPYSPSTLSTPGSVALTARSPGERTAVITVRVPPDAEVWVDGNVLPRTGTERKFETPPIEAGRIYHYEVRALWSQDGRSVSDSQRVGVAAGDRKSVSFLAPAPRTSQSTLRGTIR